MKHNLLLYLVIFSLNSFIYEFSSTNCSSGLFGCSNSTRCISQLHVCDGEQDCPDGSDEAHCTVDPCVGKYLCQGGTKCVSHSFLCDSVRDCPQGDDENDQLCLAGNKCDSRTHFRCRYRTSECIQNTFVCNGHVDCKDGSDEDLYRCYSINNTVNSLQCEGNYFQCQSRDLCIPMEYKCDHKIDCLDGSDEKDCVESVTMSSCNGSSETFKCLGTDECIKRSSLCDGHVDCTDGSDEHAALCHTIHSIPSATSSPSVCVVSTDFYCGANDPNMCIEQSWRCDGTPDCVNAMDEMFCPEKQCAPHQFQCASQNQCIFSALVCDNHADCADKSDEINCDMKTTSPVSQCDPINEFNCTNDGKICIPLSKVCDKRNDCGGIGEDERPGGSVSNCLKNLCKNNGNCSHECVNQYSHRVCLCPSGYRLHQDQRTCLDINECQENENVCSQVCINTKGSYKCECLPGYIRNSTDLSRCIAPGENALVYATGDSIRQIQLLHHEMSPLVSKGLLSVAMTFDMYSVPHHRMFYVNVLSGSIETMLVSKTSHKQISETLFSQTNSLIEGVAFDWIHNLLFWTDEAHRAIYGMNITSKERFTLVDSHIDKPRAVIVHPGECRVYWTDWGTVPRIESIQMNGEGRKVIVEKKLRQPNGLALDFTTHRLYWTDSKQHSISSYDLNTSEIHVLVQHEGFYPFDVDVFEDRVYWSDWLAESIMSVNKLTGHNLQRHVHSRKPMGIRIAHKLRQPIDWLNQCTNHVCSHICLPVPHQLATHYVCACPMDGEWKLASDQRTCYQDILSDTTHSSNDGNMSKSSTSNEFPRGRIALVVSSTMLTFIFILTLLAYVVYMRIFPRKKLTIHFENPPYRKSSFVSGTRDSVASSIPTIHIRSDVPRSSSQITMDTATSHLYEDVTSQSRTPTLPYMSPPVDWPEDGSNNIIETLSNSHLLDSQRLLDNRRPNADCLP